MFCPKCGTENPDGAKFCKKCGENLEEMKATILKNTLTDKGGNKVSMPNDRIWLQNVIQRLSSHGFKIRQDISCEGYAFKLVAHRSRFELTKFGYSETFFVFAEFDTLSRESMRQFSAKAFRYAKASKNVPLPCGVFESVWCFAVALVDVLDQSTAESVRNEAPTKHWCAAEIPIVYERSRKKLCFFEKTPIWGAAYYAGFRNQIKKFLKVG